MCAHQPLCTRVWLVVKSMFTSTLNKDITLVGKRPPPFHERPSPRVSVCPSCSPVAQPALPPSHLQPGSLREAARCWFKPQRGHLSLGSGLLRVSHAHPSFVVIWEILGFRHSFEELTADQRDACMPQRHAATDGDPCSEDRTRWGGKGLLFGVLWTCWLAVWVLSCFI